MMIKRLHELQSAEHTGHSSPAHIAHNLPQDSQDEAAQTSGVPENQQVQKEENDASEEERREGHNDGESSGSTSTGKSSAQRNGGGSSCSARLLPNFVYQASPHPPSREKEDTQGAEEGGGGGANEQFEKGRMAKQKLQFTASTDGTAEESERAGTSGQPSGTSSWSEMSSILIGSDYRLSPLSPAMEQRLILQYLTPLGDYQEVRVLI